MKTLRISRITGALVLALGLSTSVMANITTSAIKGQIQGPKGNPAAGTTVIITHVPSGTTKTATVNESGIFHAKGLRVGGPYQVVLDSDRLEDTTVKDIFLTLGETYPLNVGLNAQDDLETIVVTARSLSAQATAKGPTVQFNADDLKNAPTVSRDIKDIVRIDPRVYIDESRSDAIQCGGGSPRFNSLTVDGVRMNDSFGLNDNGYPTTRIPFSYDSIDQVAVELAPFDVKYGGFTACNINAVTKSGTNEVHGGLFVNYSNDSMKGDSIAGEDQDNGSYDDTSYGFNIGLPLIKDTLFFFGSYEKLDGVELFSYSPMEGDNPDVTQADIDRVNQISIDNYGYTAGGTPASMPVDDEKILLKLDWNISDEHRASFIYNHNDGFKLSQSDSWGMTLDNHFYESGAELNSYIASVNSDWTDSFSTSVSLSHTDLDNRQESLDAASGFGEVQIYHGGTTIFLGPDDSRQSNEMNWENTSFKLAGSYYLDEHTISGGYEYESLTAFNLFMQHSIGEYRFNSIDDYEAGLASRVYYNNSAGTNNPSDASQEFTYDTHTFYLQDEYTFTDIDLTLTVGLRYDRYSSSDNPRYNAQFEERYGMRNDANMDGIDLLQPRVGFNWAVDENLNLRGGFGLYSGGNPNVWLSNSYSNDGLVNISQREYQHDIVNEDGKVELFNTPSSDPRGPGYGVPQVMVDAVGDLDELSGNGSVNATDPNFEIPSEWKYSLGATYTTDDYYVINVDFLHNRKQNSATVIDYNLEYDSTTFDGRPTYKTVTHADGVDNVYSEYVLTNSDSDGSSTILSFSLSKDFDFGLNAAFGYSYTQSEDANPMTSAVAGSNYGNLATTDALNPAMATSDYEIPHRFTLNLSYGVELIGGLETRFSLFGQASEGQPYSFTYNRSDGEFGDDNWNGSRQLLYIPTLDDTDVNVHYSDNFNHAGFDAFIKEEGLTRGKIAGRNSQNADWHVSFDIKINQEIPGLMEDHRGNAYFVIKNVGNLLNDDWGVMNQGQFVGNRMVDMSINDDGSYNYERFYDGNQDQTSYKDASLWEMRVGVSYEF